MSNEESTHIRDELISRGLIWASSYISNEPGDFFVFMNHAESFEITDAGRKALKIYRYKEACDRKEKHKKVFLKVLSFLAVVLIIPFILGIIINTVSAYYQVDLLNILRQIIGIS